MAGGKKPQPGIHRLRVPRLVIALELQPLQLVHAQGLESLLDHGGILEPPQAPGYVVLRYRCVYRVGGIEFSPIVVRVRKGRTAPSRGYD